SYTLQTFVNAGTLLVAQPGALGSITGNTAVNPGGTLRLFRGPSTAEPITLNGGATTGDAVARLQLGIPQGSFTLTSPITLVGFTNVIEVPDDHNQGTQLILQGVLTGDGSVTKEGSGVLVLSGPDVNTNLGSFIVQEGTVSLNKPQAKAAISGSLHVEQGGVDR